MIKISNRIKAAGVKPADLPRCMTNSKALGYWNIGMLEYWVWRVEIYLHMDDTSEIKIRLSSTFHTHYSIFPPFHYSTGYLMTSTTPLG
jgi:hypothetical protein